MALAFRAATLAMGGGERLMITLPDPTKPAEATIYGLMPSGRRISAAAFVRLRPHLVAQSDGLFGADLSQTYLLPPSAAQELLSPRKSK